MISGTLSGTVTGIRRVSFAIRSRDRFSKWECIGMIDIAGFIGRLHVSCLNIYRIYIVIEIIIF